MWLCVMSLRWNSGSVTCHYGWTNYMSISLGIPDLMKLQNVELNLPTPWVVSYRPTEEMDSYYVKLEGTEFSS
jgi:hypothetical protein